MATTDVMNLNIYQLRELMSQYIDLYCDELLNLQGGSAEDVNQVMTIIQVIKSTRFLAFESKANFMEWYRNCISAASKLPHFSPFLERGYEFLMIHFYNVYGLERYNELVNTAAWAFTSVFVASDTAEERRPNSKRMSADQWNALIREQPWLIVVSLLRNTYIDMGSNDDDNGGVNA